MQSFFDVDARLAALSEKAESQLHGVFAEIEEIAAYNQQKVLKAFIDNGISAAHLCGTTGYGYGDIGRDTLDKIYTSVFGAKAAGRQAVVCGV